MTELRRVDPAVVEALKAKLADPVTSLSAKYRILFSLRNIEGENAHDAMLIGALDGGADDLLDSACLACIHSPSRSAVILQQRARLL